MSLPTLPPETLNFPKNQVFARIQYASCVLFTPRHFPFSSLTAQLFGTVQSSGQWWMVSVLLMFHYFWLIFHVIKWEL